MIVAADSATLSGVLVGMIIGVVICCAVVAVMLWVTR